VRQDISCIIVWRRLPLRAFAKWLQVWVRGLFCKVFYFLSYGSVFISHFRGSFEGQVQAR
jgi:hypothetical protein